MSDFLLFGMTQGCSERSWVNIFETFPGYGLRRNPSKRARGPEAWVPLASAGLCCLRDPRLGDGCGCLRGSSFRVSLRSSFGGPAWPGARSLARAPQRLP